MMILRASCLILAVAALGCATFAWPQAPSGSLNQFRQQAYRFSEHDGGKGLNMDAVRTSGAGCVHAAHRDVPFSGGGRTDHLGAAFVGENCSGGEGVVAIMLESEIPSERRSYPLLILDG